MRKFNFSLLFGLISVIFSCNNDEDKNEISSCLNEISTCCQILYNDVDFSRETIEVSAGTIITLTFITNTEEPIYDWSVSSNEIETISGTTSLTAEFKINNSGTISCLSSPDNNRTTSCEDFVNVNITNP